MIKLQFETKEELETHITFVESGKYLTFLNDALKDYDKPMQTMTVELTTEQGQ